MPLIVPDSLAQFCRTDPARADWLAALPAVVAELCARWSLTIQTTHPGATCSWVATAARPDGEAVVLKLGVPHFEALHELDALRLLDGEPTLRLLDAEPSVNALLLEHCSPGTPLRNEAAATRDEVAAACLRSFWRSPPQPHPFRPLHTMIEHWSSETRRDAERWPDVPLVEAGLQAFAELARPSATDVLLATDLHAGNVLRAQRKPWLVIDPKPFVGDAAYDATQHLLNERDRVAADPAAAIGRFADLLGVDPRRVRLWMFARLAAEPRHTWDGATLDLARRVMP